jgi:hypothetical protein
MSPLRGAIWHLGRATLGAVLAASATLAIASPAPAGATPGDTASTHAYLQAAYVLDHALQGSTTRRTQLEAAVATRIGGECSNVLAGAPKPARLLASLLSPSQQKAAMTPRERGEADLRAKQFTAVESELDTALRSGAGQVYAAPIAAFVATVTPLRWSNQQIASQVDRELHLFEFLLVPAMPDVCVDLRAWAASGFRILAPGTKALEAQEEAVIVELPGAVSIDALLRPYEGPSERAIIRRTRALKKTQIIASEDSSPERKLRSMLGLPGADEQGADETPRQVRLGSGKTSVGSTFTVTATVRKHGGIGCGPEISISSESSNEVSLGSSIGQSTCVSHAGSAARAQVSCDNGLLQIESRTLAQARRVRLLLSDGRTIDSAVVKVPARFGGPVGVYFQIVRGPAPYPVSLAELDAHGRTLRSVRLPARRNCHKTRFAPTPRTIATGTTPGGTSFSIKATSVRLRTHRELFLDVVALDESRADLETVGAAPLRYFNWRLTTSCAPAPYAIVYGQLKQPGDTVLAQTASGVVTLQKAAIPSALHEAGTVAYGAFAALPTELIVQDAAGHTLARESLATRGHEELEYCEGALEPRS